MACLGAAVFIVIHNPDTIQSSRWMDPHKFHLSDQRIGRALKRQ
jgi:hypothetical protein